MYRSTKCNYQHRFSWFTDLQLVDELPSPSDPPLSFHPAAEPAEPSARKSVRLESKPSPDYQEPSSPVKKQRYVKSIPIKDSEVSLIYANQLIEKVFCQSFVCIALFCNQLKLQV